MLRDKLIGTWSLSDFRFTDAEGNPGDQGDAPTMGRIEYTSDGYMATATRQSDGSYFSYFGTFQIQGDKVFHNISLSANQSLEGTTTVREISFEGDKLVLTASPPVMGGVGSKASLVWERLS